MEQFTFKYHVRNKKGQILDSSGDEVTIRSGAGDFLPSLEKELIAMDVGEKKSVALTPSEAYGEYRSDLVFEVEKSKMGKEFHEGDEVTLKVNGQRKMKARVVDFKNSVAVLDCNHPFAGLDLVFDITLIRRQNFVES